MDEAMRIDDLNDEGIGAELIFRNKAQAVHGRAKEAWYVSKAPCSKCGEPSECAGFDSSEDEYGPVWVCAPCLSEIVTMFPSNP